MISFQQENGLGIFSPVRDFFDLIEEKTPALNKIKKYQNVESEGNQNKIEE
jgi:hypothetical protein